MAVALTSLGKWGESLAVPAVTLSAVLLAQLPPELTSMTVKLETEFLRPAPLSTLQARAWLMSRDERSATTRGELRAPDGTIVATATAHLRILPRKR